MKPIPIDIDCKHCPATASLMVCTSGGKAVYHCETCGKDTVVKYETGEEEVEDG
jgi:transposase-like protein